MLTSSQRLQQFVRVVAVALICSCGASIAAAQSVPMLVQAETMTLVAPMAAGYDIAAMGGRFISVPSGANPANPTPLASVQVNVPKGDYYLWARIAGPTDASDALYVGFTGGSLARVFPPDPGPYAWVRVPTSDGGTNYAFSLEGNHTIEAGYGEVGAKLDAVYLTANATEVPNFSSPARLLIEAESMTLEPASQMSVGTGDDRALSRQYLITSAPTTTSPVRRASVKVQLPAGDYYLWARLGGPTELSDALYLGIENSFARVFPSPSAPYGWAKVATGLTSTTFKFTLISAGTYAIQVGEGETNASLDAVYLTNDASDVPTFAPMRRVIEAESLTLLPTNPPMTVGTDAAANGAQYLSVMSGADSTNPTQEAQTTVHVAAGGVPYYLWARIKGLSDNTDALYIGFDNNFRRVFPTVIGAYEWVRAEDTSGPGFSLTAGPHDIVVGHGEIGARLDALYVTDDVNDAPPGAGAPPPPPAGPCALPSEGYEGFGRNTTGGFDVVKGVPLAIYEVTHLGDSDPPTAGSLRAALSQGNRCIVFGPTLTTGGTINLVKPLFVKGANVTIDGFTAPSPGITLRNTATTDTSALTIHGNHGTGNVVVRGIRIRLANDDGITVTTWGGKGQLRNIVIDHVSVSGSGDGAIDVTGNVQNVTIQWSILGPGHPNPVHDPYMPMLISTAPDEPDGGGNRHASTRVTVHHNLYVRGEFRHPSCNGGGQSLPDIVCDFRNNLIWDYTGDGTQADWSAKANVINNYYHTTLRKDDNGNIPSDRHTIILRNGGTAYVNGNYSNQNWNLNDNGTFGATEFPVEGYRPTTTDARTAAIAVRGTVDGKEGAGARGPNFGLDLDDQNLIKSITIP